MKPYNFGMTPKTSAFNTLTRTAEDENVSSKAAGMSSIAFSTTEGAPRKLLMTNHRNFIQDNMGDSHDTFSPVILSNRLTIQMKSYQVLEDKPFSKVGENNNLDQTQNLRQSLPNPLLRNPNNNFT